MNDKRSTGFWVIIIIGVLWCALLILGQTISFINYDFTVSLGLQEPKDVIGEMGVAVNKGFGVADTLIYLPLLILGLIGLWKRRVWGIFLLAAAFGITAYFPIVCLFMLLFAKGTPGFKFTNFTVYSILLTLITLYGLWGIWYLCRRENVR